MLAACGSGTDAPTAEPAATATDAPRPATEPETATPPPQRAVISEELPYAEVEDKLVYGHFVFPSDMVEPLPAVLLIHEWWGLTGNVRDIADRLAGEGYIVLAVDLFEGQTADSPATARQLMTGVLENRDPAAANIRSAFEFVRDTAGAPRIATFGWGFGGGWALNTAVDLGDDIDAVVAYYAQVDDDEENFRPLTAPLLAHYGANDRLMPGDSIESFEEALQRLRKNFEVRVYPGAKNAFASPESSNFSRTTADEAWQHTLEFLDLHLSIEDSSS